MFNFGPALRTLSLYVLPNPVSIRGFFGVGGQCTGIRANLSDSRALIYLLLIAIHQRVTRLPTDTSYMRERSVGNRRDHETKRVSLAEATVLLLIDHPSPRLVEYAPRGGWANHPSLMPPR